MHLLRSSCALIVALAGSTFASGALGAPEIYKIDPAHSFVTFSISHVGFSFLQGRFDEVSGEFTYDPAKPSANTVDTRVATTSVDTNHAERDKHLRSKDFLDAQSFPLATFKTTSFEPNGDDGVLTGNLTLHGVTKPVKLDLKFVGAGKDRYGNYRRGYITHTVIKRADWGISYNFGPAAESMELQFAMEGIRQ